MGLRKRAQLVAGPGRLSDPIERTVAGMLDPVRHEACLADAAPATQDKQGGAKLGPQVVKHPQFGGAT